MERKFYSESFEKFLKGHADQFKMTPSKKVWHGIYNDLHPGRRWPSAAISIVFIFTLVIIGHLNTNNGHNKALYDLTALHNADVLNAKSFLKATKNINIISQNNFTANTPKDNKSANILHPLPVVEKIQPASNTASQRGDTKETDFNNSGVVNKNENILTAPAIQNNITKISYDGNQNLKPSQNINDIKTEEELVTSTIKKENFSVTETISNLTPEANAANIKKPKKITNVTWTYYVTPSISYRHLSDDKINNAVLQKPMLGYEGGTSMSFNIYKKLQFKTGLQLNYSGYNIKANNTHPIIAILALNSEIPGQYNIYSTMSNYGNNTGSEFTRLKNYSLQVSLPIGLQYVFAGNENIKFGAAADFQPSYIIASKAYLLSTDKRNYLTDPDLLRKWNMNTNFSTYVSFTSNSFNWQIGPQVRYQLLSTYTNQYPVKEHLINYGIRIGINKISK
mgnify:CR=1 FL=1